MGLMFDDIDLKKKFNFIVTSVSGRGLPPVKRDEMEMDRIDGVIVNSERYDKREIKITGVIYDDTFSGVLKKRDNLLRLFSTAYTEDKILGFSDTNRGIFVRLAVGDSFSYTPQGAYFNSLVYEFQLKFVCYNPFFFPLETQPGDQRYLARNLLSFGSFEVGDSRTDVSLGWDLTHSGIRASFIAGCVDTNAQKLYFNNTTASEINVGVIQRVSGLQEEESLFVSGYLKRLTVEGQPTVAPKIMCVFGNHTGEAILDVDDSTSGGVANVTGNVQYEWLKVSDKITVPYNATYADINVVQTTPPSNVSMFAADAVQVNNVSLLGLDVQDMTVNELTNALPFSCLEG